LKAANVLERLAAGIDPCTVVFAKPEHSDLIEFFGIYLAASSIRSATTFGSETITRCEAPSTTSVRREPARSGHEPERLGRDVLVAIAKDEV
jgi:hypothetical protein